MATYVNMEETGQGNNEIDEFLPDTATYPAVRSVDVPAAELSAAAGWWISLGRNDGRSRIAGEAAVPGAGHDRSRHGASVIEVVGVEDSRRADSRRCDRQRRCQAICVSRSAWSSQSLTARMTSTRAGIPLGKSARNRLSRSAPAEPPRAR